MTLTHTITYTPLDESVEGASIDVPTSQLDQGTQERHTKIAQPVKRSRNINKTPDPQQPEDAQPKQPSDSESLQATLTTIAQETTFQPLQFKFSAHDGFPTLPLSLRKADFLDPVQDFELFFTSEILDLMTEHTNAYAESKDANSGDAAWKLPGRIWRDISKLELKQWIGILIYPFDRKLPILAPKFFLRDLRATHNNISSSLGSPTISRSIGK